ncbi:copper ABC transporter permease [Streptococcus agalactiae LMG 14747]|uniref:Copper ABC transporter permease n=1 Tax=Streptococcus agalactiae LMG 14747 TaxID=1154860 RepID=V6Z1S6_STRAG|nr:copper ABC transporter permease [Streptococcus agalactiae LMG 14747]
MSTHFTLKKGLPYFLGFLLPFIIMAVVLLTNEIWWGSDRTILASDGFHQYVIFAQGLRNILHGSDSLFYTFTSGLGLNFYALISYYLGSFLSPFVFFFSLTSMPDAIYLFTLIKFGLSGLSMYIALRYLYKSVNPYLLLSLSTSYALLSFATSQLEINTWLDVFILLPLIILGLHRLLEQRQFLLYYLSLTILFIQNYYFGFMMAIFLVLYFLAQITRYTSWKIWLRQLLDFSLISLFSALSSAIMLVPTYFDLSTHGENFSSFDNLFSKDAWYLDIFAKNMIGAYDTTKFGSIPMIYVGLFPLVLCLIFFTLSTIKWPVKLSYALLLSFILAAFYIEPLDLLWQGMHAPNMFLHRYSWALSLTIIIMAAEVLSHAEAIKWKRLLIPFIILFLGFVTVGLFQKNYDFLSPTQLALTLILLAAYFVILINLNNRLLPRQFLISFTLIFTLFEIFINTFLVVGSLGDEWIFPTRDGYNKQLTDIENLVNYSNSKKRDFYRTERLLPQTGNDSMKFNYNGISQFSSIRNTASSSTLDRLGFQSNGTNLNLRYQNNTIIADSLFNISYNLSQTNPQKFGFSEEKYSNTMGLYKNEFSLPLGILSTSVYNDVNFTVNTLDNQANFLNKLSGLSEDYFQRLTSTPINPNNSLSKRISLKTDHTGATKVSYRLSIPAHQQVYVSVPNISFANNNQKEVMISHSKFSQTFTTDNAYSFFNIGHFEEGQVITVTLTFPGNATVSFDPPTFYGLDTLSYQKAIKTLRSQKAQTKTNGNHVITNYQANHDSSIIYTLPFDRGWEAKINNKKTKIRRVQKGFMAVDVPKGKGTVRLTFIPQGLKKGSLLSILGIGLFMIYSFLARLVKLNTRKAPIINGKS